MKTNPAQFVREVRQEITKVTWPSRKEASISTGMVFLFTVVAALFFLLADQVIQFGVKLILGLGG